jgi:hypothetical protein
VPEGKIDMQHAAHIFGDIKRTFLQARRREPHCASPDDDPAFDAWGSPRDERFIAADIDANPDLGLRGPPWKHCFADAA